MSFTATPVDGSSTPIPMSSAVPDGTNTPLPIEGGPSISTGGNTLVPVSIYEKDGNNVVLGATTDAAVVGDVAGTISAKQRGLSKILNDIWDSVNHRFHVNVDNVNTNGQALMVNSAPVVIASDQSAIKSKGDFVEIAGAGTGVVTGTNTDFIPSTDVSAYKFLSLHITGTFSLTLTFQASNDNSNWSNYTLNRLDTGSVSGAGSATATTNTMFGGAVNFRYFRVRCTAFTSNTSLAGNLELYTSASGFTNTVITAQPGNTPNTVPWLVSVGPPADLVLFGSGARTTTQTTADQTNFAGKGLRVVLDVTSAGTGSITLTINARDIASGKYVLLLAGAAVTTISTNVYVIHPELTAAANSIAKDVLPHTWQVVVTANNANSVTYSVGASYLN